MWFARLLISTLLAWSLSVSATILENGQPRADPYPGQVEAISLDSSWRTYDADAPEISYKGRWDSKHISCTFLGCNCGFIWLTDLRFLQGGRASFRLSSPFFASNIFPERRG